MPRAKPTHESHRSLLCIFRHENQLSKGTTTSRVTIKLNDATCKRIQKYTSMASYDPSSPRFINGICAMHRKQLERIDSINTNGSDEKQNAENVIKKNELISSLDKPVHPQEFAYFSTPLTRSQGVFDKDSTNCPCPYCNVAKQYCGSLGNTFGAGATAKPGPVPKPKEEVPREPVTTCRRCGNEVGRGKDHPKDCKPKDRERKLSGEVQNNPRLWDNLTTMNINKKMEEAAAATTGAAKDLAKKSMVKIGTASGKAKTIKVMTPNDVKRELFPRQILHDGLQQLQVVTGTSTNAIKKFMTHQRATFGRKSVEPNVMDKLRDANQELSKHYKVVEEEFDPAGGITGHGGKAGDIPGKVKRHVVYCYNVPGLVSDIKKVRGYHENTHYLLKLGMDAGKHFFKITLNLIREDDDLASPPHKKAAAASKNPKRFTYAEIYASQFKEAGVNGLFILACVEEISESRYNLKKLIVDLMGLSSAELGHNWMNTGK